MKVPLKRTLTLAIAAVALDASLSSILGKAPFAGTVTGVGYIPNAAITGADTDSRRIAVTNRGQAGAGTAEIAALGFDTGINAVAFDEKALTLNATPANLVVAAGDVLTVDSATLGTGLADPGGVIVVEITRDAA